MKERRKKERKKEENRILSRLEREATNNLILIFYKNKNRNNEKV